MSHKQLASLFICNLIPYITGNGLFGLLPIYTETYLEADAAMTGLALAIGFAALATSTMLSGRLSKRFQRHKVFIVISAPLSMVTTLLMGAAPNMWLLTFALAANMFTVGIQLTMTNILAGKSAGKHERGRIFGIIGAALALGQLLGGLGAGPIVDQWGFQALFSVAALLYGLTLIAALLLTDEKVDHAAQVNTQAAPPLVNPFVLLVLIACFLAHIANFMTGLGRPLAMSTLGFDSTAITSVLAVSGAINLPLPFIAGWLSDRFGRKSILLACYLVGSLGVGALALSTLVWHFWIAQIFISILSSAMVVSSALITDLVPSEQLNVNLARLSAMPWLGAVVGYTATGFALQSVGMTLTLAIGVALTLAAALMVSAIYSVRLTPPLKSVTP